MEAELPLWLLIPAVIVGLMCGAILASAAYRRPR
jgi:hypothetical protein